VIIVTGVVVTGLCVVFAWLGWDNANNLAAVISAAAGVAAVGATIWGATWQSAAGEPLADLRVARTGTATAIAGGTVNTGIRGRGVKGVDAVVEDTGDASGSGDANSGIRLD
jgi:hypothetical protein